MSEVKKYRLGRKQKRAILNSSGHQVALFSEGKEDLAEAVCELMNYCANNEFYPFGYKKHVLFDPKEYIGFWSSAEGIVGERVIEGVVCATHSPSLSVHDSANIKPEFPQLICHDDFETWSTLNEQELNCIFAESGADREMDFDREAEEMKIWESDPRIKN